MNIMLAAVLAKGQTIMENCAKEPHIVDLANFLNAMGADVKGAGTDVIKIRGVESLHGGSYSIIPDQIEAGTFMQPLHLRRFGSGEECYSASSGVHHRKAARDER